MSGVFPSQVRPEQKPARTAPSIDCRATAVSDTDPKAIAVTLTKAFRVE